MDEIEHLTRDLIGLQGDKDKNAKYKSEHLDLVIDTAFDKFATETTTQEGYVAKLPKNMKGIDLDIGDRCYTHHFVFQENHMIEQHKGEPLYITEYKNCFCKVSEQGEIKMLGGWNLVEIQEDGWHSELIINPNKSKVEVSGIARHLSGSAKELGIQEGDKVYFHDRCAYEIKVEGKVYFRVETDRLEAYERFE